MITNFKSVLDRIKKNKDSEVNCIPSKFVRYKEYFLGVIKSTIVLISASSGIGKSRFAKWAYMFVPFEYVNAHPELNIKLKIFYFSLEENKDKFIRSVISSELYKRFGLEISPRDLLSLNKDNLKVDDYVISCIEECEEYIEELLKTVEVVDYIRNGFGIYKHVRDYARQHGKFYFKGEQVDPEVKNQIWDSYVADNPDEYVIVITDPINILTPENGVTLHQTMTDFSSKYCIQLRDKFGYTLVNVQQQEAGKEKQEFTYKGQSIESKLEPSLDGLGNNKETQRDCDFVYGLFAPDRYEITNHRGYDILEMQDNYRSLCCLKDRDGESNKRIGLYFQGAVNEFSELPKAEDFELGLKRYSDYKSKKKLINP